MGQFLWVELMCPEIPMLDAFCNFLVAGRADFVLAEHRSLDGSSALDIFGDEEFDHIVRQSVAQNTMQKSA